jgi:hypothetical protein
MAGGEIVVCPGAGAAPLSVLRLLGAEATSVRCSPQRSFVDVAAGECGGRYEPVRSSDRRNNESVQVVHHRSGQHFTQRPRVTSVSGPERLEIFGAVSFVDNRRGVSEADLHQVQKETASAPVPVEERVDAFEVVVRSCERFDRPASLGDVVQRVDPISYCVGNVGPRRWCHAAGKRLDVVLAEAARRPAMVSPSSTLGLK